MLALVNLHLHKIMNFRPWMNLIFLVLNQIVAAGVNSTAFLQAVSTITRLVVFWEVE